MNKSELIVKISQQYPAISNVNVRKSVDMFFDTISAALLKGDRVEIRGFGTFCLHKRNARMGYNPNTGRKFFISEKQMPYFRASAKLKEAMCAKLRAE